MEGRESIESAKERWDQFGFSWWSIIRKDSGEIIGAGCVQHIENEPDNPVEVGWRLKRDRWGHGYATEAARAMIAFAFDVLGLAAIHATTHPSNERSINVIKRWGCEVLGCGLTMGGWWRCMWRRGKRWLRVGNCCEKGRRSALSSYSHSIVAGGLPEISYTTRLIPRTSLMIRFDTWPSRS
ncbi:GNAT family N-acetyltransferase [Paraburkholderia azotifigens]|uniref:GNAT family N-acetyltransferase n=1 Tax=Paraburkholderia azotifigens TaxID=2057004 RepID=A0ABU9R9R9_9BURK|nr:GNAT family N-acetyltransferase [Paraburkholderia azotifigens]